MNGARDRSEKQSAKKRSAMDRINEIIDTADFAAVNTDLLGSKAWLLSQMATDLRGEVYGVIQNSPNSFRVNFRIEEDDDIGLLLWVFSIRRLATFFLLSSCLF